MVRPADSIPPELVNSVVGQLARARNDALDDAIFVRAEMALKDAALAERDARIAELEAALKAERRKARAMKPSGRKASPKRPARRARG